MDHSISSIGESSFSDIIDITEIETETISEMKVISEKLDKEVDEDLVSAFNDISENEDKSEDDSESDDDHLERNLHTDSSFTSERDLSLTFSAGNPILHEGSIIEFDNGLTKENSCNETDESNATGEYDGASIVGQTGDKNKLASNVQNLVSDYQYEKNELMEAVTALKSLVSSVTEMKNNVDEDLASAFNDISENEDKSEDDSESDDDHRERNLHTDSSFTSERDLSLTFSVGNPILHEGSIIEFENGLTKENSYNETDESNASKSSHSALNSNATDEYNGASIVGQTGDKNKLASNVQNLVCDYQYEKNELMEAVTALKSLLSSVTEMKNNNQSRLESSEFTIQLLKKQLNGHLSQLHDDNNSSLEELKLRYERDILRYKENMDQLQSLLNSKMKEAEDLALDNSELQRKYQLQIEKAEWISQITDEFLAQKKCQLLLESGTIEEVNRLKLRVHHLEEEKSRIEKENSLLKESFFLRWTRSLLLWQFQCLRRAAAERMTSSTLHPSIGSSHCSSTTGTLLCSFAVSDCEVKPLSTLFIPSSKTSTTFYPPNKLVLLFVTCIGVSVPFE